MSKYYYDLHIHSCLSPCADDDMTPNNIAGMATLKGLNILALTDHNSCKNCPAFFEACRSYGIVAVAGMELSTAEDIHLVCLFEELSNALAFDEIIAKHIMPIKNRPEIFGNQIITNGDDESIGEEETLLISPTDLPIREAVDLARKYGAHVRPAHIDRESNGIIAMLGDIPTEYDFNYFELNDKANRDSIVSDYNIVNPEKILVCSDAHHLWDMSEAENSLDIPDEPYSSSLVRKNLFKILNGLK